MNAVADVTIRLAAGGERNELEALQWRASLANEGDREAMLANPDAISLPASQIEAGLVVVAEAEGAPVGFAALIVRDDADVDLDGLFVEPRLWRGGVGHALVNSCCERARDMKATYLHVLGNPHALGFYEKCGFEQLGLEPTRFGSAIIMRKKL